MAEQETLVASSLRNKTSALEQTKVLQSSRLQAEQTVERLDGLPAHSHFLGTTLAEELPEALSRSDFDGHAYGPATSPPSRRPSNSDLPQAHSSAAVFSRAAPPLHLPVLDAYLDDATRFPPPRFSDARTLCSSEEARLCGYELAKRERRRTLEVAGAQLCVPEIALREQEEAQMDASEEEAKEKEEVDASPGVSLLSTATSPRTRLDMFPPLMLLRTSSLDELKSNAVGPRAPPGGVLAMLPGVGSILGTVVDFVIGIEGSAFAAGIFRLGLLADFAQLMALQLHFDEPVGTPPSPTTGSRVRRFLLHTLPSFLALDFVSLFGKALLWLCIYLLLALLLLWRFWRFTRAADPNRTVEGFGSQPWLFTSQRMGSKLANILVVFTLSVLYIPLSKLALDTLTWQADFWPADAQAALAAGVAASHIGSSETMRASDDFCWSTTLQRDEFNFAWLLLPLAAVSMLLYTFTFPYLLATTLKRHLPRVSNFNELGTRRTEAERDAEYVRLLNRDKSPLNFMYNAYRRRWGYCELAASRTRTPASALLTPFLQTSRSISSASSSATSSSSASSVRATASSDTWPPRRCSLCSRAL